MNAVFLLFIVYFNSPLNAVQRTDRGTTLLQHLKQLTNAYID